MPGIAKQMICRFANFIKFLNDLSDRVRRKTRERDLTKFGGFGNVNKKEDLRIQKPFDLPRVKGRQGILEPVEWKRVRLVQSPTSKPCPMEK